MSTKIKQTESAIQSKIVNYLKLKKVWYTKVISASHSGIPDILCCYKGKFIAFEVKQPGRVPTALQQMNIDNITLAGGYAYVVSSVTEVKNIIDSF